MVDIFINLKRFDVPKKLGGVCPVDNPQEWIEWIIHETANYENNELKNVHITYFVPESLLQAAVNKKKSFPKEKVAHIEIGCQGVYRENIIPGKNFGAFTTNLPAVAAKNIGALWAIIGHSEERKDKIGIIERYDKEVIKNMSKKKIAVRAINEIINDEIQNALKSGLNILVCIGETEEERGSGSFEEIQSRVEEALRNQIIEGLSSIKDYRGELQFVIGYEPIWAIGPGKNPPGPDYIAFVSSFIKEEFHKEYGFVPKVVYGGGLKKENAAQISGIDSIDGGLIALTRFSGEIGFEPMGLKEIICTYLEGENR